MPATAKKEARLTPDQYLELERKAEFRSEYADGEVYAMSGGTVQHNLIGGNLYRELGNQLEERPCLVFTSDMKVWIGTADKFAYPDVSALCGEIEYYDEHTDVVTNPTFIAEVLSPSTEAYDLGDKFRRYRTLATFREYLTLSQLEILAEFHERQDDGSWLMREYSDPDDSLDFTSIGCRVRLGDLYRKVEFV
jgi:Uma2 family endonuclease